jgi:hypothetical protein
VGFAPGFVNCKKGALDSQLQVISLPGYSIREKVSNSIFIFRATSLTSVGKPPCFLHFLPWLHMALSYQTVSKTLIAHVRISVGTSISSKKSRRE